MSSVKRGSGLDPWYNSSLFNHSTEFSSNPAVNRERIIEANLERNIAELAMNRFKWSNLPEEMDERFIEKTLLLNGLVVFYWEDSFGKLVAAKGASTGYLNFMDWPVSFTIIGPGSQTSGVNATDVFMPKQLSAFIPVSRKGVDEKDLKRKGFPVWPNYFRIPEIDTIRIYSTRLATVDRTLEINTKNARRNKILTSTTNQQLSMVNLARQIDEGVDVIQVKDSSMPEQIQALDLGIDPDSYDKLSILRTRWWNECMGLLGIDNANQDKKERLVAAEVGANDSQTDSMRFVALNARRQGVAYINEVFDLNIEVDFNVEVEEMARQMAAQNGIDANEESESEDN